MRRTKEATFAEAKFITSFHYVFEREYQRKVEALKDHIENANDLMLELRMQISELYKDAAAQKAQQRWNQENPMK